VRGASEVLLRSPAEAEWDARADAALRAYRSLVDLGAWVDAASEDDAQMVVDEVAAALGGMAPPVAASVAISDEELARVLASAQQPEPPSQPLALSEEEIAAAIAQAGAVLQTPEPDAPGEQRRGP
jgi:hypothetical protein